MGLLDPVNGSVGVGAGEDAGAQVSAIRACHQVGPEAVLSQGKPSNRSYQRSFDIDGLHFTSFKTQTDSTSPKAIAMTSIKDGDHSIASKTVPCWAALAFLMAFSNSSFIEQPSIAVD